MRQIGINTSPERDFLLCALSKRFEDCSAARATGCYGCQGSSSPGSCIRLWDRISELGTHHFLREEEYKGFLARFKKVQSECLGT